MGIFRYLTFRYNKETRRYIHWLVFKGAKQSPKPLPRAAHFHVNLLYKYRTGPGVRGLMLRYFREVEEKGVRAIYGQMVVTDQKRTHFFKKYGFEILDRRRITKFDRHQEEKVYLATIYKIFDGSKP